jgi:hypothetical protein
MPFSNTKLKICMHFWLLISKCKPELRQAVPGSNVFFPGFFALGGIHFALWRCLILPALADENSMAC